MNLYINLICLASICHCPCFSEGKYHISSGGDAYFRTKIPGDLGLMTNPGLQEFNEDNQYKISFCSNYCPNHTMCVYQKNPHGCPRNITRVGLLPTTKLFIVRMHNLGRHLIASGERDILPTASNMQSLSWENELSTFAQRWANQCIHIYKKSAVDECRDTLQYGVNQLVYTKRSKKRRRRELHKWQQVIGSWFESNIEISLKTLSHHKLEGLTRIDRYAYLLNAAFQYIGCGYMEFKHSGGFREVYVCNYGPVKYSIAKELYIPGYPCSRCFHDQLCSNMYTSLCKDDSSVHYKSHHHIMLMFWFLMWNYQVLLL